MRASRTIVLATLGALYMVQGLPFGFQADALPLMLAERGASDVLIGFSSALAAPWMGKALFAPLVDRYGSTKLGRRKSWILPLTALLALTAIAAAFVSNLSSIKPLLAMIFLMNLFAAMQDIAVDGLAVDIVDPADLGPANSVQVVGYRLGMLTAGGLLVWASKRIGWHGLFYVVSLISVMGLVAAWFLNEPSESRTHHASGPPRSIPSIFHTALAATKNNGGWGLIAVMMTYKMGESMADGMWKPFLVKQAGYSAAQLGLWVGTYGTLAAIAGSITGGLLARRLSFSSALLLAGFFRALGIVGQWILAKAGLPSEHAVIGVTVFEHFFGGMITPVMFALMMSRVDRSIGATHYTFLATLEVIGKSPSRFFSGVVATHLGYTGVFAVAAWVSLGFLALIPLANLGRVTSTPDEAP